MMAGFHEAIALVHANAPLLATETVALADAVGRITAEPVRALADHPPFDASAMDGFAVPLSDALPATLMLGTPIYAGGIAPTFTAGTAFPISTGAPVPIGSHAVIIKEKAILGAHGLTIDVLPPHGLNIRRRGEDAAIGDVVLAAGRTIRAPGVGALTSYGVRQVVVRARPRIAIISSGDELRPDAASAIHDANGPMLCALFAAAGADAWLIPPMGDDRAAIAATLGAAVASKADIIVTTGGVSAGDRDFIPAWLADIGARTLFAKVPMRPGKPTRCAQLGDGRLFFGLPGNPAAALVAGRFFVMSAIRAMLGVPPEAGESVPPPQPARPDATLVLKAMRSVENGEIRVEILPGQQSHRLRPLLDANCWLVIDAEEADSARLYPLEDRP